MIGALIVRRTSNNWFAIAADTVCAESMDADPRTPVHVRDADPELDGQACAAIYAPYVAGTAFTFEYEAPSAHEMGRRIAAAYAWLIAEVDGRPIGYAYGGRHQARAAYRWAADVSVYVERENDAAAATPPDIRLAFGTALTMWMAALDHIKSTLSPDLQAYLTKIKGCSPGGYCLLTPPQVVEVRCPSSALFIVRWVTTASEVGFLDTDVAKARMQGRTVLINADTHAFRSDIAMQHIKEVSTINLITVMVHELGHSFGLVHSKQVPSIMAPTLSLLARQPTDDDAATFAGLLEQSIQGGPAGEFNASDCAGLEDDLADALASNAH